MKQLHAITLIAALLLLTPAAFAQSAEPHDAPPREPIPGMGFCTEQDELLLDRASGEYASIMFPKKYDTKHREKVKEYYERMGAEGITERLIVTYMKCERAQDEFFPPKEKQDKLRRQYLQDVGRK